MSASVHPVDPTALAGDLWSLDALAAAAFALELPFPHERRSLLLDECARLVDGLLTRVARGRSALDLSLGDLLAALATGEGTLRLGFASLGDYARERLGIAGRTAQAMAHLSRELRRRPLLRAAVRAGEVSTRKAEVVLPVAAGAAEAAWVERARRETVRALEAAVRSGEPEEEWERVHLDLTPEGAAAVDEALALAGRLLGAASPVWQRVEAICQEYLSAYPHAGDEEEALLRGPSGGWLEAAKEALEAETDLWCYLEAVPAVAASGADLPVGPEALDAELRRLASLRGRWDEVLGHLALLARSLGLWRVMGFASFAHYTAERLGMAARTVEQRASLERRLRELPPLRQALRDRRLSYEQARLVAGCADEGTVHFWIRRAEGQPCIALRREIESAEAAQMRARGELRLRLPRRVASLLSEALAAARAASGRWIRPSEALERVARHFVDTWKGALAARSTPSHRALLRDGGLCRAPGCSRPAAHAHHVQHRARGGGDELDNLLSLCAAHHLRGVHGGHLGVTGPASAPRWSLAAPLPLA